MTHSPRVGAGVVTGIHSESIRRGEVSFTFISNLPGLFALVQGLDTGALTMGQECLKHASC